MQFHELIKTTKKRKRVGRGGKRGTYSGKGNKGQKARAGNSMRPAIWDIVKRFPKNRGYTFKRLRSTAEVTLEKLNRAFKDGDRVTLQILRSKGLAQSKDTSAKIIATGIIERKLELIDIRASQGARLLIEKAGGVFIDSKPAHTRSPRKKAVASAKKHAQSQANSQKTKAVVKSQTKTPAVKSPAGKLAQGTAKKQVTKTTKPKSSTSKTKKAK